MVVVWPEEDREMNNAAGGGRGGGGYQDSMKGWGFLASQTCPNDAQTMPKQCAKQPVIATVSGYVLA